MLSSDFKQISNAFRKRLFMTLQRSMRHSRCISTILVCRRSLIQWIYLVRPYSLPCLLLSISSRSLRSSSVTSLLYGDSARCFSPSNCRLLVLTGSLVRDDFCFISVRFFIYASCDTSSSPSLSSSMSFTLTSSLL